MERRRQYYLLIYQVPSKPTAARVGIWRELKRIGVLYLQQSVCIVPSVRPMHAHLLRITARIDALGGDYHLLPIRSLPAEEEAKIINGFLEQRNAQYGEIIENCEVNFSKEIEFEIFRQNFSYAEAEEIRQDLDKIRRWYQRVVELDWFGASRREEALGWISRCEKMLEEFEERVFAVQGDDEAGRHDGMPAVALGRELASAIPLPRAKVRRVRRS
ncbi:MAG TPA: Chromate resistance protein ChrB [Chloroflexota bacterium]|jgi:hypothetical protein